ncbi:MAG: glycoside hydrolase family 13 protein [Spirochaetales bacterium]|nr:glycoside hydrolase family 13 protein [Candidatus Physcosoma equi]
MKLSILFSEHPEKVYVRHDTKVGIVYKEDMWEDGTLNGAYRYSLEVPVFGDDYPFSFFFAFFVNGNSYYYSKDGVSRNCPKIGDRFVLVPDLKTPQWVAGSVCYQIFPDRFCNGDPTVGAVDHEYGFDGGFVTTPLWTEEPKEWVDSRCVDFYNGDLKGIEDKVLFLKSLGVSAVYINPIFESRSVHRYDTVDFRHVDHKLGGDEALASMVETLHRNGIRVILDISINHTGLDALWLKKAREDKNSDEAGFYYFKEDGGVMCWQDVPTLPQLDYRSEKLRSEMYRREDSVMKKFLKKPYDIDGWRLDVAPEVGRRDEVQLCQEVWREVRENLKSIKEDMYLVGEDWDDSALYMQGDIWDGTMNYYGCGRPLRSWMGQTDRFLLPAFDNVCTIEEPWTGREVVKALKDGIDSTHDQMAYFQMNLIDSHDTPRLHNDDRIMDENVYLGAVLAMYMLPGMPNLYYGDEVGLKGRITSNEGCRFPMEWREENWNRVRLQAHQTFGQIRGDSWFGYSSCRLEETDEKSFAMVRFTEGKAYCAFINRGEEERTVSISAFGLPKGKIDALYGQSDARIVDGRLELTLGKRQSCLLFLHS